MDVYKEILALKKKKNAIILAHNYQDKSIYKIADFIGDSLELAKIAQETTKDIIIFCGVYFMAETAKILNPLKTVLIPNEDAGCPMADLAEKEKILEMKRKYPNATTICYINTTADVKTVCDICVTSSNAEKIINSLQTNQIIFLPDKNLASFVSKKSKKEIIPYDGYCYVHNLFTLADVERVRGKYPDSFLIVHPEAPSEVVDLADHVCSTSKMIEVAKDAKQKYIIIGTETGMIQMLKLKLPHKNFIPLNENRVCKNMKKINLKNVLNSLQNNEFEIELPNETIRQAKICINKMLELS